LRRLLVAAVVLSALSIGDGFLYLALQRREEFAAQYFPLLFAGTALVYLVLAIPFGRLADRFGRVRVFLAGHLALAAAYAVAAGLGSGVAGVLACLALLGAFYAATDGVIAAAAAGRVPTRLRGSGIALAQTAVAVGRLVAGVVFGAAWSLVGRDVALYGFALVLLVVLAGVTLIWRHA
jgi:MFS family permease